MQITFNITADHLTRLVNALCGLHNYQAEIADPEDNTKTIPNPETRPAFAKRIYREWGIAQVKRYEESEAKKAAETAITEITITE